VSLHCAVFRARHAKYRCIPVDVGCGLMQGFENKSLKGQGNIEIQKGAKVWQQD
jgi:hypothetical protein